MEKDYEQLKQEYEEFYANKVRDLLPEYNARRRNDQPKVIAFFLILIGFVLVYASLLFAEIGSICVKLMLAGMILTFGSGCFLYCYTRRNGKEDVEIDIDYEVLLKNKLMPKFLKIFGKFEWFKLSTNIMRATTFTKTFWDFMKEEVIIPTNFFYDIDDVIEGYYKDVRIRIVETKIGACLKHLLLLPFIAIPFAIVGVILFFILSIVIPLLKIGSLLLIVPLLVYLATIFLKTGRFRGIIIELKLPKNFAGYSFMCERRFSNRAVIFKKSSQYKPLTLEDINFNKNFKAWTDNQVEARYVLTPTFIERFLNIRFAFNANYIRASFRKDKMVLMVNCKKDLFSMGNLNKETTKKTFDELFDEIYSVLMLVDELKLNQRIGL